MIPNWQWPNVYLLYHTCRTILLFEYPLDLTFLLSQSLSSDSLFGNHSSKILVFVRTTLVLSIIEILVSMALLLLDFFFL